MNIQESWEPGMTALKCPDGAVGMYILKPVEVGEVAVQVPGEAEYRTVDASLLEVVDGLILLVAAMKAYA